MRPTIRVTAVLATAAAAVGLAAPLAGAATGNDGAFTLTAHGTSAASGYAPTFTGNGLLGVRVPPTGQGYAGGTVPAQSELAGFYARNVKAEMAGQRVQQRANIPTWSTLQLAVGGRTFSLKAGSVSGYRQSIDLHTGVITTQARWRAPDGHVTDLTYQVLTDRGREHVGLARLTLRPRFTGTATVTDAIDGTADTKVPKGSPVLTEGAGHSFDPANRTESVSIRALGTGITADLVSTLAPSANVTAPSTEALGGQAQSAGQRIAFPVSAGQTYTFTKYVGIRSSDDPTATSTTAAEQSAAAASAGWPALLAENRAAWAQMWQGRIDVAGDRTLATDVNASEFYLWSSTRADQNWSVSPAGLSSNGYDGHIFWDAETWMYPTLLAQHPDLAAAMNAYRYERLGAATTHSRQTGTSGARFPWESALDGTEQIPPPVSINSEGLYEVHITADIALAQWQYWLATHDSAWLANRGWPVLSGAATYWASRATREHGQYVLTHVTGPDEENPNVAQEAYTQVGARTTLRDAIAAAHVLHRPVPAAWVRVAAGLKVPVANGVNPEFRGYQGQQVKQADVTLLAYPWGFRSSPAIERADINFYVPRTDPGGPSMSDAANTIETAQLSPGSCQAYVNTERSYQPFIRDVFHQFSETRTGGAFTFMTGIGGFLQEFLYGYSGMRWESGGALHLAPSLSGPLTGVTLRDLHFQGRVLTVAVHRRNATVTLESGPALRISTPGGASTVSAGHAATLSVPRSTGAGADGSDALRCQTATATNTAPGAPALAAIDGSAATDWQPLKTPASLTATTAPGLRTISRVTIRWGQYWPPVLKPNVHPKPRPVLTLRARRYAVQVRTAHGWRTAQTISSSSSRLTDVVRFPARSASAVRLVLRSSTGLKSEKTDSAPATPLEPMVQELTAR